MMRLLGLFLLTLFSASCATIARPPAIAVVESPIIADGDSRTRFAVTIHVILQVHEHSSEESRARQDLQSIASCQAKVVDLAVKIAAAGVKAIVVEGLFAAGSFANPEPIVVTEIAEAERSKAKWLLAQRSDLAVYGFELKALNDFGVDVVEKLGNSVAQARDLNNSADAPMNVEDQARYQRLIQEEFTRLNLWHAGIVPERSFLALQTALAVALARRDTEVQLVIGKQHWGDLVYAVNRHQDLRLRLVPYTCD